MVEYRIGSRGSALAKAQVNSVIELLRPRFPQLRFTRRVILENGDRDRRSALGDVSAASAGAAFAGQQQAALLAGEVDVIVHSLKDLPTTDPAGLMLLAPPGREEVADALCGSTLAALRPGARVGTSSPRRAAQLLAVRPDLTVVPMRGNVPTRLRHLSDPGLDAVVLAVAGLRRLGRADAISEILPVEQFAPSPGQGALGLQVRADDIPVRGVFSTIGDPAVDAQVRAERAMLARLHGGCTVPVGAVAHCLPDGRLRLLGQVSSPDGARQISAALNGQTAQPEQLGHALAAELIGHGAHAILNAAPVG